MWAGSGSSTGETASIPSASSTRWSGRSTPTCSCARSWVIEHVAGARGQRARPRPCDEPCRHPRTAAGRTPSPSGAASDSGRRSIARSPPATSATRSNGTSRPDSGPQFRFYFDVIRGSTPTVAVVKVGRGHRHAEPADDRLQPHTARRRLPAPSHAPRGGPDPTRDRSLLGGEARPLLPDADLVGPVHGPGLRRAPLPPVLRARTAARRSRTTSSRSFAIRTSTPGRAQLPRARTTPIGSSSSPSSTRWYRSSRS